MAAMLVVFLVIAVFVYEWLGLAILRRRVNFDRLGVAALVVSGIILIA